MNTPLDLRALLLDPANNGAYFFDHNDRESLVDAATEAGLHAAPVDFVQVMLFQDFSQLTAAAAAELNRMPVPPPASPPPAFRPTFQPMRATNSTFGPGAAWAMATDELNCASLSQPCCTTR